jgi:hypothetical protein
VDSRKRQKKSFGLGLKYSIRSLATDDGSVRVNEESAQDKCLSEKINATPSSEVRATYAERL